ncbi:MAG: PKD domain-containing protein [Myxococcota bacterium]
MWLLLVSSALAQTSPFFNVICTPEGPFADADAIDVECSIEPAQFAGEFGTWESAKWFMGDGTVYEGDEIAHTYADEGAYSIGVQLDGFTIDLPFDEIPENAVDTRLGDYFTVCGLPRPEFELIDKGGLRYDVVNISAVDQARCLREIAYQVTREGSREPLLTFDSWEPSFEVPSEGLYTVSLTMVGLGGEATADVELDAEFGLTSDYYRVFARACSTAPMGSTAFGTLVILAVAAGRRRRR